MSQAALERSPVASRRPIHLWVVGVLSLLWSSIGVFDHLATQLRFEPYMGQFSSEQLAYFYGFPAWVNVAWVLGVWGALAGSIGLLLARRWAVWMFAISILGMAGTSIYSFALSAGAEIMGTEAVVMSTVIWVVALALLAYAVQQQRKGVLT